MSGKISSGPQGKLAIWLKRLANVGFTVAAVYCVYLIAILLLAAKRNAAFEGQSFGAFPIERYVSGHPSPEPFTLSVNAERRAIILWATWCGPCHALLSNLDDEVKGGALKAEQVIAVSVAEPVEDVAAFLKATPLPFVIGLDRQGVLARAFKLSGTPTVVLVDEAGLMRNVSTGGFGLSRKIIDFLKSAPSPSLAP